MTLEIISEQRCFGGVQGTYRHLSHECAAPMRFSVFVPALADGAKAPTLTFLAGLTCTEETFMIKAGAQRLAAELGLILVCPDTSPRATGIDGATDDWDFGEGAGFYLDATTPAYAKQFRMYSYVVHELPALIAEHFPTAPERAGLFGHSMGGHGALTIALKNPTQYQSVSAFSPIVAPTRVPWGEKALPRYLGKDRASWANYDACELVAHQRFPGAILIDQGQADRFLVEQLRPELFEAACAEHGQAVTLRRHDGYDHSYWFIQTLVGDHLRHHARALLR